MRPVLFAILPFTVVLAGCETTGANYVPVVDGAVSANFNADLAQCQQIAARQPALGGDAAANTAATAGAAAAGTAIFNNTGTNVRDAAVVGAIAGLAGSAIQQNANKEQIVRNCMRGRGYNVVG